MIRVAVVDDHPVFRLGMAALLDSFDGVRVVGSAASATEARALLGLGTHLDLDPGEDAGAGARADVVLLDLDLGDGSGVDVTRDLVRADPAARVLVVTMHEDEDAVVAAVRAGARGFLVKSASPAEVERAVRAVADGAMILSPSVADRAMAYVVGGRSAVRAPFPQLTDREREVLDLVAAGLDNASISRRLVLSPKTVRNHVANVLAKLAVRDRAAAIVRAREEGLGGG
ncbi:two component transcriptional regulator, LuxR family [Cellulosimicrobium aquatile]|uniref:Two component transcriptional regulator, LuxR family n=2 Tax=Cellulosimicrobium TaxID=157920 RepID=A0A1N6P0B4_9MICO|nr:MULTISPECIES: response regulator transcription factor [Cellulosimicrobium]MCM3535371.1 response regulator transcription factor [Cellulosimicrobium funkei]SIP97781.1 two component transcriptional regulator, LuxR family [Cellulosimicrobium aquatile]